MKFETISASAIGNFLGCQQRWKFRYVDGLKPVEKAVPLSRGIMLHEAVQCWWRGETMIPLFEQWRKNAEKEMMPNEYDTWVAGEFANVVDLAGKYRDYYGAPAEDVVVVATEFELTARLPNGKRLIGYVDLVASWGGQLWAVEIKSASQLARRMAFLNVDPQVTCYCYGMRQQGMPISGILFDGISTYPYKDRDAQPGHKLFNRVTAFRNDEQLAQFEQDTLLISDEMEAVAARGKYIRNLGGGCQMCPFKGPCHAEVQGDIRLAEALKRTDFKKRTDGDR